MNNRCFFQRAGLCFVLLIPCCAIVAQEKTSNAETYSYLAGQFELIGRLPDSAKTYQGTVRLVLDGARLRMERTIDGKKAVGSAKLDVSGSDRVEVLRGSFTIAGDKYEATYLWRSDLDNYPIVTGRVFGDGTKMPGIEAWFPLAVK